MARATGATGAYEIEAEANAHCDELHALLPADGGAWLLSLQLRKLQTCLDAEYLRPCPAEKLGLVQNTQGLPMAAKVMYHKEGRGKPFPAGVLVGAGEEKVGDAIVFMRFHVHSAVFAAPPAEPRAKPTRSEVATLCRTRWGKDWLRADDHIKDARKAVAMAELMATPIDDGTRALADTPDVPSPSLIGAGGGGLQQCE